MQFKKTKFGFLWDPLSLLIVATLITSLWSIVLDEPSIKDYFAYILCGYTIWMLLSALVDSSSNVFITNWHSLTNEYQPLYSYCLNNAVIHLMRFLLVLPIVLLILAVMGKWHFLGNAIILLFSLFFTALFGMGISFLLGSLALFYRDVRFLMGAIMRLAFLLTPIIWKVERLGEYQSYIYLNPLYPYLEASRSALLNDTVDKQLLIIMVVESTLVFSLGLLVVLALENKIRTAVFQT